MIRIAQIIPYFGKWPEWMPLYLYSCGRNPMVDFIFYTDCEIPETTYSNTKFIKISFDDYCKLVGERLGIDYQISKAYKLTDLKPFIGKVHEKELLGYDWWGFGDIDLIYGDLSMLINDDNLKKYDILTTHNYHIAGHCTFVRNNEFFRNLCLKIVNWKYRLSDEKHYGFDEAEWSNLLYPNIKWPLTIYSKILSKISPKLFNPFMNFANRVLNPRQLFKEYFTRPIPKDNLKWTYNTRKSSIYSPCGKELPYLHFLFFKKTPWLETENYWKAGYYRIKMPFDKCNYIYIDTYGISND